MKKHKIVAGLICSLVLSAAMAVTAPADTLVGDVDKSGAITARDALAVLQNCAGIKVNGEFDFSTSQADITGDGVVDVKDARVILKTSVGTQNWDPETPYVEPFSGQVIIMADSIAAGHEDTYEKYERPLYGWGVIFPDYFNDKFDERNMALSSRSTKSYIIEPNYGRSLDLCSEGDYVFISYGHNDHKYKDGKPEEARYTSPNEDEFTEGSFKWYLKNYYIDPVLERGGVPILMSCVCRATFDDNGNFVEEAEHLLYGKAMKELYETYKAAGKKIYFIDTQQYTYDLYKSLSKEEVMSYHGLVGDESYGIYNFDNTHYCLKGAKMLSEYIISQLKAMNLDICRYLKP